MVDDAARAKPRQRASRVVHALFLAALAIALLPALTIVWQGDRLTAEQVLAMVCSASGRSDATLDRR